MSASKASEWVQDLAAASQAWDRAMKAQEDRARERAFQEAMFICQTNPRDTAFELWRRIRLRKEGQG